MEFSKIIVDRYKAKLEGQQLLWTDYDYILRYTKFQPVGDRNFDQQAIIHWWMNIYIPRDDGIEELVTPYAVFESWSNALRDNFKYVSCFGYFPSSNQSAIQVRTYKGESVEDVVAELEMWLPYLKAIDCHVHDTKISSKETILGQHVKIQEYTLSEYGVYSLQIFDGSSGCGAKKFEIGKTTYGHYRVLESFATLKDAITYISRHHWLYED
jgi:hypothetical protein